MTVVKSAVPVLGPAQAARRLGISIKALRHYEAHGLVRPKRSLAGWRRYGGEDIERLERLLAFRAMGFPVAQIAALLDASPEHLALALATQERRLERQAAQVGEALAAVRAARRGAEPLRAVALACAA